ncbi:MAG: tryptophan synthase subunit alpha [Thermoplasmata archaeon]|nr:tryptophan synthase subunit alpha [Candidatus Sysuiplasma acidicola]
MTAIAEAFEKASSEGRSALISYVMGADPDPESFLEYAAAVSAHSDILEVGIPFSDPIADGPTIQAASVRALERAASVRGVIEACSSLSGRLPVVIMCYYNTIHRMGEKEFVSQLSAAGVSGVIVPDLPFEEGAALFRRCRSAGIDGVLLISPATHPARARDIASRSRGFLYVVSRYGVTGESKELSARVASLISSCREISSLPISVGFGIATPEHVSAVTSAGADGVVVGSAIVARIGRREHPDDLSAFVAGLKAATRKSAAV